MTSHFGMLLKIVENLWYDNSSLWSVHMRVAINNPNISLHHDAVIQQIMFACKSWNRTELLVSRDLYQSGYTLYFWKRQPKVASCAVYFECVPLLMLLLSTSCCLVIVMLPCLIMLPGQCHASLLLLCCLASIMLLCLCHQHDLISGKYVSGILPSLFLSLPPFFFFPYPPPSPIFSPTFLLSRYLPSYVSLSLVFQLVSVL